VIAFGNATAASSASFLCDLRCDSAATSSATSVPATARQALADWQQVKRQNFYTTDTDLQAILLHHLGPEVLAREAPGLTAFGAESATVLDDLIRENNRDEHLPQLRRWDGIGRRIDEVIFHPSYFEIGQRAYRTGALARYARPGEERIQLAYSYLLAHHGEGGHLCPFACTAGLIKILQARGNEALKAHLLPGLLHLDRGAPEHYHGAQFLTEIQGGSDVGANAVRARRDGEHFG
jgi:acyl-CoA dehydrogenase